MSASPTRNESLAMLALVAQCALAIAGGIGLASLLLPAGSEWVVAGGVGLFAAVWAGYGAAFGFAMLLAPLFVAQAAARLASHGDVPGSAGMTRADRAFDKVASVLAVLATVLVAGLTGLVLWAVAGAGFFAVTSGFLALGAGLAVLTPHGLRALG
jgi:hypothetical protein